MKEVLDFNPLIINQLITLLEIVAGILISTGVIWKVFGPKIKHWVGDAAMDTMKNTCRKVDEMSHKMEIQEKINLVLLGNAISSECKDALSSGLISLDSYRHIDEMYEIYRANGGNGTVKKLWTQVKNDIEIERG